MSRFLLLVSFVLLQSVAFPQSQVDHKKVDSLQQSITRSLSDYQKWQDSFNKAQMQKSMERSQINAIEFAKQYEEEREKRQQAQAIRYIVIGVVFLAVLIVGILRKRRKSPAK